MSGELPLVQVYGHPRSGNHLCSALLYEALYEGRADTSLVVLNNNLGHWSQRSGPDRFQFRGQQHQEPAPLRIPYGRLLGGHAFTPPSSAGAVYIVRDGRDVALSCYRWARFRPRQQAALTIGEYLRKPIDWEGSPGWRAAPRRTLFAHWCDHVAQWLDSGAIIVRYEELVADPNGVLQRVAAAIDGLGPAREVKSTRPVGWSPSAHSSVGAQRWQREMRPEDAKLFDEIVPLAFRGRWDVPSEGTSMT